MRSGELAKILGVPDRVLRRLAKIGLIPAKRLPTKQSHWNFSKADVELIRTTLTDAGLIEEARKARK